MTTLFLMNPPSPDRTPYLNDLARLGHAFIVIYVPVGKDDHGWGVFALEHPHLTPETRRQAAIQAAREILSGRVSELVCYGYRGLPFATAIAIARLTGTPILLRSDTNIDACLADAAWRRYARRLAARLIIPSRAVAWSIGTKNSQFWRQEVGLASDVRIPYEVLELPGGEEPSRKTREPSDVLRILYVGRLAPEKRVQDLIRACKRLPRDLDWQLTIVGQGPELSSLQLESAADHRVEFVGSVPHAELGKFYARSHIFALPSSFEPWGLVVNEALGFGLYTVTSDAVGAAPDLIVPGKNGETYRSRDVLGLASALERAAKHTEFVPQPASTDTALLMRESLTALSERSPESRIAHAWRRGRSALRQARAN